MRPTKIKTVPLLRGDVSANPPGREALRRFRTIFAATQRHYGLMEKRCGVGGAQVWALAEIARKPGLSVRELSKAMAIHQATASNLIERLASLGLIRRQQTAADRRVAALRPTSKGEALLRKAPKPVIGILQDALLQLSPSALERLNGALDQVIACMHVRGRAASLPLAEVRR